MYLSYSGYKRTSCLFAYWLLYIGKLAPSKPDDRLGSIYGTAVGKLFEAFYRDRLWDRKDTRATMESMIGRIVDETLDEEQKPKKGRPAGVIIWKDDLTHPDGLYYNRDEIVADVKHAIARGLQTIKLHRFLGRDAEAETKLDTQIDGHTFAGRCDFKMTRVGHGDLIILDGKGSKYRGRYLDSDQLLWYCLLHWVKFGTFPDWAGFLHWKASPGPPHNVDFYTFTKDDALELKEKVLKTMRHVESLEKKLETLPRRLEVVREHFTPIANEDNCRFCPHAVEQTCPQGLQVVQELEEKIKKRNQS